MISMCSTVWHLSADFRHWMEDCLGADLGRVQVRFDPAPRRYGTCGFASGHVVVLLPQTIARGGQGLISLLAHELTHVVQQRRITGADHRPASGLLHDEALEADALARERYAACHNPFAPGVGMSALLVRASAGAPAAYGDFIQCHSSGYDILPLPDPRLEGGLRYFRTDFPDQNLKQQGEKLRKSFREAIEHYVRLVLPGEVGVETWEPAPTARKKYVDALYKKIKATPYLLKELMGNQKVAFDDLSVADQRWVHDELYRAWDKLRVGNKNMRITERICMGHMASWIDFRAVDCVFAAILRTLTELNTSRVDPTKVKGGDPDKAITTGEKREADMETWLAEYFHVARTVTPDVQLIHLLESDLGWKNVCDITTFQELKAGPHRGNAYIVSYERTPGTATKDAFWHTVYVAISGGGNAAITDRQATGMGFKGSIADSANCDAWRIDTTTTGFQKLKKAFDEKNFV
jgi:Domain of unknown function (DUF4157)